MTASPLDTADYEPSSDAGADRATRWHPLACSRRELFQHAGVGLGSLALLSLLVDEGVVAAESPRHGVISHPPTAKSVIFLFMGGAPSQVDTWDPKPELSRLHGRDVPPSIAKDVPRIARSPLFNLLASPYKFQKHGQSGIEVSELFPHTARWVDTLCVIRSCRHNSPIHAPAEYLTMTGTLIGDRPSLGAWLCYGLGSENSNLPGFVVCTSDGNGRSTAWSSGFLPSRYQGTLARSDRGVANLELPPGISAESRRAQLDLLAELNRRHQQRHGEVSELDARIRAYELAFRMQMQAPEAFDVSGETAETLRLYGLDQPETAEFGRHCLWARRLVERGVRFVQLRNGDWDAHSKLKENHDRRAARTDRPIGALLADLHRRGLLDQTLVIWGGEFGRTPAAQGTGTAAGRDHSPSGYTMWLAGGGVRGGQVIGATDPVGYAAIDTPVHPNDLHATILHALGIDQEHLYYVHHNRREKVTVNGGQVVTKVFG
jgi:hypothetical protein